MLETKILTEICDMYEDELVEFLGSIGGTSFQKIQDEENKKRIAARLGFNPTPPSNQDIQRYSFNAMPSTTGLEEFSNKKTGGIPVSYCHSLKPWQQDTVSILRSGKDVYLLARPGAGKTLPILCYYYNNCLNLNTELINSYNTLGGKKRSDSSQRINTLVHSIKTIFLPNFYKDAAQVVIALPRRTLLTNYEHDNIFSNFAQIIRGSFAFLSYHALKTDDEKFSAEGSLTGPDVNIVKVPGLFKIFMECLKNFISVTPDGKFTNTHHPTLGLYFSKRLAASRQIKTIWNSSNSPQFKQSQIKVELDKINHLDTVFNKLLDSCIESFIKGRCLSVFSGNKKYGDKPEQLERSLVTLCITESLINDNIIKSKQNLRLFFIDEAHELNFSENGNVDYKDLDKKIKVVKNAFSIISKNKNNCRIALATGTMNENSAKSMISYINRTYKRDMVLNSNVPDKNPSNISIRVDNSIGNINTLTDMLVSPRGKNNLIVVLSTALIDKICEDALKQSIPKNKEFFNINKEQLNINKINKIYNTGISNTIGINLSNAVKQYPKVDQISDPFLRNCVLCGFGFIYRNKKNPNDPRTAEDHQIVSALFSSGKIHTLVATTSVGIGVNIKVKNMYIPDPTLPGKHGSFSRKPSGIDELSQLLNRTGRADFEYANIFTTSNSLKMIEAALYASNDEFERRFVL